MQIDKLNKIFNEIANDYHITPEQAEELYKQFWQEHVLRNMSEMASDYINVPGIGAFKPMRRTIDSLIKEIKDPLYNKQLKELKETIEKSPRLNKDEKLHSIDLEETIVNPRFLARYYKTEDI